MKIIKLILLFIFIHSLSFGQAEKYFADANGKYKDGKYSEAIELYQKVVNEGFEAPELFYNLGNAYYKTGKLGYAILYFEKALELSPDDSDILYNLQIAKAHTIDKIEEVPTLGITRFWDSIVAAFSLKFWAILTIVLFILLLGFIRFYFYPTNAGTQRIAFIFGSTTFFILLFVLIIFLARSNIEESSYYAVLVEDVVTAKVSPSENDKDAFIIHAGLKFKVEEKVDNWIRIKLSDGKVAWIPKSTAEFI